MDDILTYQHDQWVAVAFTSKVRFPQLRKGSTLPAVAWRITPDLADE
jgi:hypothetical protein